MSLLPLLPAAFCASVQKAGKFRAARRHARSATPLTKGLPTTYWPPSTCPRPLADATAARIKWNRVIFCGRTKRWNSAGE